MKSFSFIIITLILIACQNDAVQDAGDDTTTEDDTLPKEVVSDEGSLAKSGGGNGIPCNTDVIIKNSDPFSCENFKDSMVFYYDNYTVKTQPHEELNGNVIEIRFHKYNSKVIIGKENSAFFMGLVGNNAIIDEGTGQMRTLFIYDAIVNNKLIFSDSYVNDLRMENGYLLFDQPIDAEFVDPKPECPEELKGMEDYIGYVGVYKYDFKAKGSSFTGEFRCQYFE